MTVAEKTGIDYLDLLKRYEALGNGAKADIKRVASPHDLRYLGTFFRLCESEKNLSQLSRVVFILPWLRHQEGKRLGRLFNENPKNSVSEARVIQMMRSETPQDLICLRRMIWQVAGRHAEKSVDWNILGPQLYYWGDLNKQKILQDYYLAEIGRNKNEEE